jgi:hypothetical protein
LYPILAALLYLQCVSLSPFVHKALDGNYSLVGAETSWEKDKATVEKHENIGRTTTIRSNSMPY